MLESTINTHTSKEIHTRTHMEQCPISQNHLGRRNSWRIHSNPNPSTTSNRKEANELIYHISNHISNSPNYYKENYSPRVEGKKRKLEKRMVVLGGD